MFGLTNLESVADVHVMAAPMALLAMGVHADRRVGVSFFWGGGFRKAPIVGKMHPIS